MAIHVIDSTVRPTVSLDYPRAAFLRPVCTLPSKCAGCSGSFKYDDCSPAETILEWLGILLIRTEVSIVIRDPLASFLPKQQCIFHIIFGWPAQNPNERLKRVLFTVQGPPGELLL
jgi:hypothetical protein